MKIKVRGDDLKAALARAMKAAPPSGFYMPVMTCCHIAASDDVQITCSDFDKTITVTVPAKVLTPGEACLPAAELAKLASYARKAEVEIDAGLTALVAWGETRAELVTQSADEFPRPSGLGALNPVDGPLLAAALQYCVQGAAPHGEVRNYLQGVYVCADDRGVLAVASDGYRLHLAEMPMAARLGTAIIPTAAVPIIADMAALDGEFKLGLDETRWAAARDGFAAYGKVIDSTYPNFRATLVGERTEVAIVDCEAMIEALDIALVGAEGKFRSVAIRAEDGTIAVRGIDYSSSLAVATGTRIDAEVKTPARGAFGAHYIKDALKSLGSDRAALFTRSNHGILDIEPVEQRADLRLSATIMGIRATEEQLAA